MLDALRFPESCINKLVSGSIDLSGRCESSVPRKELKLALEVLV